MLARLFVVAAIFGLCLAIPAGVAIADDKPDAAVAPQTPSGPPQPQPGWDEGDRPQPPRGDQPPPPPMRGRAPRGGLVPGGPGMGMGGPGRAMPGRGGGGAGRHSVMGGGMRRGRMEDPMRMADPEMYELLEQDRDLERSTMQLREQFLRAPDEAKAEVRKQLEEVVGRHFEVRQQRRQLELHRLEEELKRLNEAIQRRQETRDDIIKRRIMQLTWEKDHLDF